MDNMENDIKILRKLLDSELFLSKFPIIKNVAVYQYGRQIDIVLIVDEADKIDNRSKYWPVQNDIHSFIWNLAKIAGITTRFKIYP